MQWKISGQLVFFRASACCSKILNDKTYIFNTVNSGQTLLSGQAQVAQKSWMIKIFQYSETFQGNSYFSGQAQVAQKSWMVKSLFNTVGNFTANSAVFQGKCAKIVNTVYSAVKGNYRKVSCLGEHNTQETSPPWVNKQGNYRVCR